MAVERGAAKFPGQTIPAIRFVVTDREAYRPVRTSLLLIDEIRRHHPKEFAWGKSIDRLTGSDKVRLAIDGGTLPDASRAMGFGRSGVPRTTPAVPALRLTSDHEARLIDPGWHKMPAAVVMMTWLPSTTL